MLIHAMYSNDDRTRRSLTTEAVSIVCKQNGLQQRTLSNTCDRLDLADTAHFLRAFVTIGKSPIRMIKQQHKTYFLERIRDFVVL